MAFMCHWRIASGLGALWGCRLHRGATGVFTFPSRLQCGRADGYILEGRELEFYLKKMQKKKGKQAA